MIEPKPFRKPLPHVTKDPAPKPLPEGWMPDPEELAAAPLLDQWRIYDRRVIGVIDDGKVRSGIGGLGLVRKLFIRGNYCLLEDGRLFRLGVRSYPGT